MSEPRCPGCHHPTPLHTMDCDYRNPLYPILTDLIAELRTLIARTESEGWPDEDITYIAAPFVTTRIEHAEARLREVQGE